MVTSNDDEDDDEEDPGGDVHFEFIRPISLIFKAKPFASLDGQFLVAIGSLEKLFRPPSQSTIEMKSQIESGPN